MPRKRNDDPAARVFAAGMVQEASGNAVDGEAVVDAFETAEFETAKSRVGGEEISLRRVVLTSRWEVHRP